MVQTASESHFGWKLWEWAVYAKVSSAGSCYRWPRAFWMPCAFGCIIIWEIQYAHKSSIEDHISQTKLGYGGKRWSYEYQKRRNCGKDLRHAYRGTPFRSWKKNNHGADTVLPTSGWVEDSSLVVAEESGRKVHAWWIRCHSISNFDSISKWHPGKFHSPVQRGPL